MDLFGLFILVLFPVVPDIYVVKEKRRTTTC